MGSNLARACPSGRRCGCCPRGHRGRALPILRRSRYHISPDRTPSSSLSPTTREAPDTARQEETAVIDALVIIPAIARTARPSVRTADPTQRSLTVASPCGPIHGARPVGSAVRTNPRSAPTVGSAVRTDMLSFPRSAWECILGRSCGQSHGTLPGAIGGYGVDSGRRASLDAFPRGAWERAPAPRAHGPLDANRCSGRAGGQKGRKTADSVSAVRIWGPTNTTGNPGGRCGSPDGSGYGCPRARRLDRSAKTRRAPPARRNHDQ